MKSEAFFEVLTLLNTAPSAFALGDDFIPHKHRIKTIAVLRKQVLLWRDSYNPSLTDTDVDDLVGWLNRNFYKLEE
jgi:hypothetical protein